MLALGIRYLNGWSMASHPADRERSEWPPHPDRVFMALAAAHFETRDDPLTGEQQREREALEWLASLAAAGRAGLPSLAVAAHHERTTVTSFVPVNDSAAPVKKGKALTVAGSLPIGRDRQPRQFAVGVPEDPVMFLVWRDADPAQAVREALQRLCEKVTRIGHSASLTQVWIDLNPSLASLPSCGSSSRSPWVKRPATGCASRHPAGSSTWSRASPLGNGRCRPFGGGTRRSLSPFPTAWRPPRASRRRLSSSAGSVE